MKGKDEEVDTGPHYSYVLRGAQAHLLLVEGREGTKGGAYATVYCCYRASDTRRVLGVVTGEEQKEGLVWGRIEECVHMLAMDPETATPATPGG